MRASRCSRRARSRARGCRSSWIACRRSRGSSGCGSPCTSSAVRPLPAAVHPHRPLATMRHCRAHLSPLSVVRCRRPHGHPVQADLLPAGRPPRRPRLGLGSAHAHGPHHRRHRRRRDHRRRRLRDCGAPDGGGGARADHRRGCAPDRGGHRVHPLRHRLHHRAGHLHEVADHLGSRRAALGADDGARAGGDRRHDLLDRLARLPRERPDAHAAGDDGPPPPPPPQPTAPPPPPPHTSHRLLAPFHLCRASPTVCTRVESARSS